jgi:hypothetical protein
VLGSLQAPSCRLQPPFLGRDQLTCSYVNTKDRGEENGSGKQLPRRIIYIRNKVNGYVQEKDNTPLKIVKIVLDVMSPAQQSIVDLLEILSEIDRVAKVDIALSELEKNVEDFKVTLEGYGLDYGTIREAIKEFGGVIRNVDNVMSEEEYFPRQDHDKLTASMLVLAYHSDANIDKIEQIHDEFDETMKHIRSTKA